MGHFALRPQRHRHRPPIGYDTTLEHTSSIPRLPSIHDVHPAIRVSSTHKHPFIPDTVAPVLISCSTMRETAITRPGSVNRSAPIASRSGYTPYPKGRPSPRRPRLEVGGELPKLSPEQQTRLQTELLPGRAEPFMQSGITIAHLRQMSRIEGQVQTEVARMRTAAATTERRAPPPGPAPITAEQRARGRLLRYIALYEDEYREDILEYMYRLQVRPLSLATPRLDHVLTSLFFQDTTMPSRSAMEQQTDIDMTMRAALIDFMIELHAIFHLRQETLYLGINILDRYTSRRVVNKKHYQLVGCVAIWIAAKFEDAKDHIPNTGDLKQYCRGVYEENSFMQMEGHVLATIDWELGHPTSEAWFRCMVNTLDRSGSAAAKEMAIRQGWVGLPELETRGVPVIMADLTTQCIGRYLMEAMAYQASLIDVPPCVIAEAALILAKVITWKTREVSTHTVCIFLFISDTLSYSVSTSRLLPCMSLAICMICCPKTST